MSAMVRPPTGPMYTNWQGQRRSPRRLERYPIYVLDVTLPAEEVDVAYDPKKRILGYRVCRSSPVVADE